MHSLDQRLLWLSAEPQCLFHFGGPLLTAAIQEMIFCVKPPGMICQDVCDNGIDGLHNTAIASITRMSPEHQSLVYGQVNRLDMPTSGLMVMIKGSTPFHANSLGSSTRRMFWGEEDRVFKLYTVLITGDLPALTDELPGCTVTSPSSGYVSSGLIYDQKSRMTQVVAPRSRLYTTVWHRREVWQHPDFENLRVTLLNVRIIGGMRHQIRAHLKYILRGSGAIVDDVKYGGLTLRGLPAVDPRRLYLHASLLAFRTDQRVVVADARLGSGIAVAAGVDFTHDLLQHGWTWRCSYAFEMGVDAFTLHTLRKRGLLS